MITKPAFRKYIVAHAVIKKLFAFLSFKLTQYIEGIIVDKFD